MTARCRIAEACYWTGLPARTVQNLAASGKIPGAAKLGGLWTFDRARLRGWIRERERACGASQGSKPPLPRPERGGTVGGTVPPNSKKPASREASGLPSN